MQAPYEGDASPEQVWVRITITPVAYLQTVLCDMIKRVLHCGHTGNFPSPFGYICIVESSSGNFEKEGKTVV